MKKILLIFGIFIFSLFLSSCSKKMPSNVVQIKFASWGSQSEVEILKPIIMDFEKLNPDIKIEFIHIPQNYFQKIHLLFASNLAPDVIFINNLYLPVYANANVLEPIKRPQKGEFYEKALDSLTFDGNLYAVPRDISNMVIYYNKDLFDKYGISYPRKNWTFEDFLEISLKIKEKSKNNVFAISFEEAPALYYLPYLMSEGGGILSRENKLIIDSENTKKGLYFYSDLRKNYNVAPTKAQSASATMAQLFLQEKLAMHLSGRWMTPKYKSDAKFKWAVVEFPRGDFGSVVPLDASGWAISKTSKYKKQAKIFIDFLASKEGEFAKSGLIVPAKIDVATHDFLNQDYSNNKVFLDVIKHSIPTPVTPDYNEIQDNLKEKTNYLFN